MPCGRGSGANEFALEPDALENKFYAAGVGLLLTIDLVSGERLEFVQIITH